MHRVEVQELFMYRRAKLCCTSLRNSNLYMQAYNYEAVILLFYFLLYKLISVCRQRGCMDGSVIPKQAPRNSSRALKSIGHSGQTVSLQHHVMHTASKNAAIQFILFF